MHIKIKKKFLFIIFCCFLFLSANFCSALILEAQYPTITSTGSKLVSGTDIQLPQYFKYMFDLGMFVGFFAVFLSFIIAGVLFFISPVSPDARAMAKDRVSGAISGLLILLTLYLIVTTINPQLAFFNFGRPEKAPPPPDPETPAGVYLYNQPDCSAGDSTYLTSSSQDLGALKNRINGANIVQHPNENVYYVAMLYDTVNYRGRCQWINPQINNKCQQAPSFANSASVYQYNPEPNGDGIYFYFNSGFNKDGGYLKIYNSQIRGIYIERLNNLKFTGDGNSQCTVPEENRICVSWNEKGVCVKKECPDLSGENITSIKIKGNYIVFLIYFDPNTDKQFGPWTFCQAFPTADDASKEGPNQIKWESARNNNNGMLPNWMVIIPVAAK